MDVISCFSRMESEGGADGFGYALHFFGWEVEFGLAEVHVCLGAHGHEVDVGVWHFESDDTLAYLAAGHCFADSLGYALGKELHGCKLVIVKIKDVVDLALRNDEDMSRSDGVDVEKREKMVVLGYLI